MLVADAVRAPWEITEILGLTYPEAMKDNPKFVALLTEYDVNEFEKELQLQR